MRRVLPIFSILAFTTPAFTQSVDDAGAGRITESLSRYLGAAAFDKGMVKVSVDGDSYRLVVDFDAIAAMVPKEAALSLDLDPYTLRLKPQADGTFAVDGALFPNGAVAFQTPATEQSPSMRSHVEWSTESGTFSGIFDPALATFSEATGSYRGMKMLSRDDMQKVTVSAGSGSVDARAVKSAGSGVDFTSTQTITDVSEILTMTPAPGSPPTDVTITSPKITADSSATGLQSKPILDLVAFGVAHADQDKIAGDQAELKRLMLAALPLWTTLKGGYDVTDLSVQTTFGQFGVANFGTDISVDGIRTNGSVDYDFEIAGITVPAGLAPGWSTPLLPTDVSLNFGVRNLNSEGPVRQFIEAVDFDREPPISSEVGQQIQTDFMASPPTFVMGRSVIRNKDTEIVLSGEMPFPLGKPALTATVEVAGYDTAVAALQSAAASEPAAQQVLPFALAAKGLAKALPDGRLQWVLDLKADGSFLVNGTTLKGPDPIEVPLPTP